MDQDQDLQQIASKLKDARVAVVGDFIADRYVYGRPPGRLSREAPVIVLDYEEEKLVPGSAANTVNNLTALGASTVAIGVVGQDAVGEALVDALGDNGADTSGICRASCETVVKTRIMAGDLHTAKQQVIRIDRDRHFAPDAQADEAVCASIRALPGRCDVLVVSDYGYGTVTERAREEILALEGKVEWIVDSHDRLAEFPGAWMVTPNEGEGERMSGIPILSESDAIEAGRKLRKALSVENVLLTRGNQGMILFSPQGEEMIPIFGTEEITDVSGAGDTVAAFLAAARSAGAGAGAASHLANLAAGVVVMKRETATCSLAELRDALDRSKV